MYLSLDLLDFFVEFQKLKEFPNEKSFSLLETSIQQKYYLTFFLSSL